MFKKILVPIDGSENSRKALTMAIELAKQFASELVILHAGEISYSGWGLEGAFGAMPLPGYYTEMTERFHAQWNRMLDEAKQATKKSLLSVKTRLEIGSPVTIICNAAEKESCDLIVMGSRGLSDFKGLFLGSVSHGVLQRSHCPVMLVKETPVPSEEKKILAGAAKT